MTQNTSTQTQEWIDKLPQYNFDNLAKVIKKNLLASMYNSSPSSIAENKLNERVVSLYNQLGGTDIKQENKYSPPHLIVSDPRMGKTTLLQLCAIEISQDLGLNFRDIFYSDKNEPNNSMEFSSNDFVFIEVNNADYADKLSNIRDCMPILSKSAVTIVIVDDIPALNEQQKDKLVSLLDSRQKNVTFAMTANKSELDSRPIGARLLSRCFINNLAVKAVTPLQPTLKEKMEKMKSSNSRLNASSDKPLL